MRSKTLLALLILFLWALSPHALFAADPQPPAKKSSFDFPIEDLFAKKKPQVEAQADSVEYLKEEKKISAFESKHTPQLYR